MAPAGKKGLSFEVSINDAFNNSKAKIPAPEYGMNDLEDLEYMIFVNIYPDLYHSLCRTVEKDDNYRTSW